MIKNKKMLILVPADNVGGAEKVLHSLVMQIVSRENWSVDIYILNSATLSLFGTSIFSEKVNVKYFSKTREINGAFLLLCHLLKNRKKYDIAISSFVHCNAFLGILRFLKIISIKFLLVRESTLVPKRFTGKRLFFYKICYFFGYRFCDYIVFQTDEMRRILFSFAPWLKNKPNKVLPNPIFFSHDRLKPRFPLSSPITIISVGRLIPEKGFDNLIKAFSYVVKEFPRAILKIYGEGVMRNKLQDIILERKLSSHVLLCGFTEKPAEVMRNADLCVVSSLIEGFPNVLLEMMSVNSRVVSTLCADGISDLSGIFTCQPNNIRSLGNAIIRALNSDVQGVSTIFDAEISRRTPSKYLNTLLDICEGDDYV